MSIRVRPPKLALAPRGGGIKPPFFALSKIGQAVRWAYNFDGATNRGVLANRAINVDGDIDISWYQKGVDNTLSVPRNIVSQNISATVNQCEFMLRWLGNSGGININVGGLGVDIAIPCLDGSYRVRLIGTTLETFFNGQLFSTRTFARGTAREPIALTHIGCRNNGGSLVEYINGVICNLRINGVLYPISDRNQTLQLPYPSRLGAELIDINSIIFDGSTSDRFITGNEFGYTAVDTWGQRSFRIPVTIVPNMHYLLDVEMLSGYNEGEMVRVTLNDKLGDGAPHVTPVTISAGATTPFDISSAHYGSYRDFGTVTGGRLRGIISIPNASALTWYIGLRLRHNQNGRVVRLKNFTLRPLSVANALELVTNGDFSGGTSGWSAYSGATLGVVGGQGVLTTSSGQNSRAERSIVLEANTYYVISGDLVALSGVSNAALRLRRGAAGNYAFVGEQILSAVGKFSFVAYSPASDGLIQFSGDGVNAGTVTVDNISVRKLDSFCNPITLVNTTSPGWQQIDAPPLPLLRWAYTMDGVDDSGMFNQTINLEGDFSVFVTVEGFSGTGSLHEILGSELNFKISAAANGMLNFFVGDGTAWQVSHASKINLFDGKKRVLGASRVGNLYRFSVDDIVIYSTENASVVTPKIQSVGRRHTGGIGFVKGRISDVVIKSLRYAISDRNQSIQLPFPTGLGSEVLPSNRPFIVPGGFDNTIQGAGNSFAVTKGTTASRAAKSFSAASTSAYLVECTLDSADAGSTVACFIRDGSTPGTGTIITSISALQPGLNRMLFNRISGDANILFVSSTSANFNISSVSIRELGTCNPLILSNTTSPGWQEIEA